MISPKIGLSLMPEQAFLDAAHPLFESGDVDIIEWSFDMCWGTSVPQQCLQLLNRYSAANSLLGHGVSFSLLTARRTKRQELWLQYLQSEVRQYNYQKISEHFGFLTTDVFIQGSPLPMPFVPEMVDIGVNNLQAIRNIAQVPVGIENLGFAFSRHDVHDQGKFITAMLEPVDGFLLLDIHNVYCNMINFDLSFEEVTETLPLHRAKEMHVSGGSFRSIQHENKNIYCDSHDAAIPQDVFALLENVLPQFPHVETIIFERLGNTLLNKYDAEQFHDDFNTLKSIIKKATHEQNA